MLSESTNDPLDLLVNRLLDDGDLPSADCASLGNALQADIDAQTTYVDFVILDELLKETFLEVSGTLNKSILELLTQSAGLDHKQTDEADATTKPPSVPTAIATPVSPVLRFLGGPPRSLIRPIVWSTALVALLSYGGFTIIAWNLRPDRLPNRAAGNDVAAATVSRVADVRWSPDTATKADDSPVQQGELLKINSGTIELELKAGAKLVVKGPAEWTVDSDNSLTLKAGKLFANVPSQAVGFTLNTPSARIVDLGTEFGVEADSKGATEVQMFKGKVELHWNANPEDSELITLTAGMARRIEPADKLGNFAIREIASQPDSFVRSIPAIPASQRRPIAAADAIASSTGVNGDQGARNLVNGSGMRGDRHGCLAAGTMWRSEPGTAKDQFVLFDLGRRYRLDTIKIWNYNDEQYDAFRTNGAKQLDVYVSNSGDGDPISKSAAWTLAVTDHPVAQGTGTSDYSTPEIVSLPQVEGRYVALVIDDAWQLPPRTAAPLFTFAPGQPKRSDDGSHSAGMYGSEFVTSQPLVVKGLGTWVSQVDHQANRIRRDYTAALYRLEQDQFSLEKRVTVTAGTAIDGQGFAFAPAELQLAPNCHYAVAAYLGTSVVGKTPYAYGMDVGTFRFGTRFQQNRFAFTTDPAILPRSRSEDHNLTLGPLLGGNLLVQQSREIASESSQKQEVDGVGLSEVQFFGTRIEAALQTK